jgi:PAS domain S-box-containing protein
VNVLDDRILVLMPTVRDGARTAKALAAAGLPCELCSDMGSLCAEIARGAAVALLTEEAMADGAGGALHEALAAQPAWSDFPLVVLARERKPGRDPGLRETMNVVLIERPVKLRSLLSVIRVALRSRRRQYEVRGHLSERARAAGTHAYLIRLSDALRPLDDPDRIQATANRVLGEHLGANRVAYFEVREGYYVVQRDYADGLASLSGRYPVASFGHELIDRFLSGLTVVEFDATNHPGRSPAERAAFAAIGIRGHVDVPLVKGGKFVAGLTVHFREPKPWTAEELAIIEQTAERTWAAVERARAERALRAEKERFRTLFMAMDEGYCVIEPVRGEGGRAVDYRYLLANPALEHHTGLRDIVGKTALEIMPGHERDWIEAYAGVADTGIAIRRTGHAADLGRWFEVSAFPVGGGLVGVLFTDVTQRHQAVEALRESEARLADVFEHAPSFMCVLTGADHVFERVNARYLELVGGRELIGQPVRRALPEVEGQGYFEILDEVYRTGVPFLGTNFNVSLLRNGRMEERVVDFVYQPLRGGGGTVRGVLVQGLDTTERKRAEAAVRERDERLQLAVAIARMGTFEIDPATDAVAVNEPGRDIYGWSGTRTTFAEVRDHFHPQDRERVMRLVEAALRPDGPGGFEVEQRIVRVDGAVRWLRVRGRALFEGEGPARRAVLLVGAYLDVTEQKEAEAALRDADRKKDDFIALLAHELRNPLAPLHNGLQVLKRSNDPAARDRARGMMDRQLSHMVRLIDDLLDVSRIGRNKMDLRRERIALQQVLDNALETSQPAIEAAGHSLILSIPAEPILLHADLTRLAQVFSNLLSNSAKYTPRAGTIRLDVRPRGPTVEISVADNGIGIPPASLPTIFDMFSQVDRSIERSTGGLGIGLALVKGLTEMHGGSVSAASDGTGSTFTVTLPVADEVPAPNANPAERAVGAPLRILVVDDNRDGAESLAQVLELLGHEVRTAHDGLEAVEQAGAFRPQVVLMDLGMPRLNGYDATREIRKREWGGRMKIIALTGWGQEADRQRSRDAGCDGHLVKPVRLPELEALLAGFHPDSER